MNYLAAVFAILWLLTLWFLVKEQDRSMALFEQLLSIIAARGEIK